MTYLEDIAENSITVSSSTENNPEIIAPSNQENVMVESSQGLSAKSYQSW